MLAWWWECSGLGLHRSRLVPLRPTTHLTHETHSGPLNSPHQSGVDINATNHEGRTPLHACYANAAHAEMLLAAGADPTVKEKKHPHTAFLHAVYNGCVGRSVGGGLVGAQCGAMLRLRGSWCVRLESWTWTDDAVLVWYRCRYNDVVAVMLRRLPREQLEASDGHGQVRERGAVPCLRCDPTDGSMDRRIPPGTPPTHTPTPRAPSPSPWAG